MAVALVALIGAAALRRRRARRGRGKYHSDELLFKKLILYDSKS